MGIFCLVEDVVKVLLVISEGGEGAQTRAGAGQSAGGEVDGEHSESVGVA